MPFFLYVMCWLAVVVASFLLSAGLAWVCGRLFRVERRSLRRAAMTALALTVLNIAVSACLLLAQWAMPADELTGARHSEWVLALGGISVMGVGGTRLLRRLLQTTGFRAACILGVWFVIGSLAGLAGGVVLRDHWSQAFVIPTGHMYPTLLGNHAGIKCANCGARCEITLSHRASVPHLGRALPAAMLSTRCWNCGATSDVLDDMPARRGDRVLVDRTLAPQRWDLVVFEHPLDPPTPHVMRLVGLPGEHVRIAGGDVFVDGRRLQNRRTCSGCPCTIRSLSHPTKTCRLRDGAPPTVRPHGLRMTAEDGS